MTPVACGIPYGQEDWFVFFFGFGQCFFAPWMPIHGVIRVLEEIRGCGVREFVHGTWSDYSVWDKGDLKRLYHMWEYNFPCNKFDHERDIVCHRI